MPTRVLVIEDHALVREVMVEMLTMHGFEVFSAPDGSSGIELAFKHLPDVVVSDYYMPGSTGLDVLQVLRQDVRTSHIPFALMSMDNSNGLRRRCEEAGADAFLPKGFSDAELVVLLNNLVQERVA
jgi:CheY-like chemotaxis protein